MLQYLLQILIGLLGGVAASLQAPFAGIMGQKVGDLGSVFFTYGGGALLVGLIVFLSGGGTLANWRDIPWYAYAAGPLGLVIIGSISYTVPRLGASTSTTLFVIAWLVVSAFVDQFGWFGLEIRPLNPTRLAGIAALLVGTWLVVK
ncbi:MAG: DMT family transporter [Chloroflexota bacterium]